MERQPSKLDVAGSNPVSRSNPVGGAPDPSDSADAPWWRDRAAVLLVGAAVLLIVGSLLPWLVGRTEYLGVVAWSGVDGQGDGGILIAIGVLLVAYVRLRRTLLDVSPALRRTPLVLGVVAAVVWVIAVRHLVGLADEGEGGARLEMGVAIAAAGAVLGLVGGWLTARNRA